MGMAAPCGDSTLTKLTSIQEAASVPYATAIVQDLVADQLTQRLQVHEQTAWMLLSLLES